MKDIIMCKKEVYIFKAGEVYEYWSNFGGLNHIVSDGNQSYPFDGTQSLLAKRYYIYDFFWTKEEMRNINIDKIVK